MSYRSEVQAIYELNAAYFRRVEEILRKVQDEEPEVTPQAEYTALAELYHGMQQVEEGCQRYLEVVDS